MVRIVVLHVIKVTSRLGHVRQNVTMGVGPYLKRAYNVEVFLLVIQPIATLPKYGHGALNMRHRCSQQIYPAIYVISCVGEKSGKIKIVSSFSAIKLHVLYY